MKEIEKILKVLANKRRLQILRFVHTKKEATVTAIAAHLKLSFKSTSRHLALLYAADVLTREQRGLQMYYRLHPKPHHLVTYISNSHE